VVASLGHYNPHSKETVINKEKTQFYLDNGAQPSERVVLLLKSEGVKLPKWVEVPAKQEGKIRNPEKLRRNQPKEEAPVEEAPTEEVAEETTEAAPEAEAPVETEAAEEAPKA
jgi:small subunit ribosomal protein S16